MSITSTKPYLLRAIFEWCVDQRLTPYLAVTVDARTHVPRAHVKEGQIVLNIGQEATHELHMGNEFITFAARFGGVAENLSIPVDRVTAIYARENGHGMAFEVDALGSETIPGESAERTADAYVPDPGPDKPSAARPHLVRVK